MQKGLNINTAWNWTDADSKSGSASNSVNKQTRKVILLSPSSGTATKGKEDDVHKALK